MKPNIFSFLSGKITGNNYVRDEYLHLICPGPIREDSRPWPTYDSSIHIPEMKKHLNVMNFYKSQDIGTNKTKNFNQIRHFIFVFYKKHIAKDMKYKKKDGKNVSFSYEEYIDKNKSLIGKWEKYIEILNNLETEEITEEVINNICIELKEYDYYICNLPLYMSGIKKAQEVATEEDIVNNRNLIDELKKKSNNKKFSVCCEDGNLLFMSHGRELFDYRYNKNINKFEKMSSLEKICSLIVFIIGSEYNRISKPKIKNFNFKNKVRRNNFFHLSRIITSNRDFDCRKNYIDSESSNDYDIVKFSDIINYFTDIRNRDKIIFDFLVGEYLNIDRISLFNKLNIYITLDHNELNMIHKSFDDKIIQDKIINNISAEELMKKYCLYGKYYLNNLHRIKGVGNDVLSLYRLLLPICFIDANSKNDDYKGLIDNDVMKMAIKDIESYFQKKDNHFDRKKSFVKNLMISTNDNIVKFVINYRNRIIKSGYMFDDNIIDFDVVKRDFIEYVFRTFFTKD